MARSAMGAHRRAVTRMLRATGLANVPEEALLVELLKDLARQMDEDGGTRVAAAYLSATKDLRRVLAVMPARVKGTSEAAAAVQAVTSAAEAAAVDARPNDLASFKQRRGIA